jgi:hypothetical protein
MPRDLAPTPSLLITVAHTEQMPESKHAYQLMTVASGTSACTSIGASLRERCAAKGLALEHAPDLAEGDLHVLDMLEQFTRDDEIEARVPEGKTLRVLNRSSSCRHYFDEDRSFGLAINAGPQSFQGRQ